jgi:hypothetical protein
MITAMVQRVLAGDDPEVVAADWGPWEWDSPPDLTPIDDARAQLAALRSPQTSDPYEEMMERSHRHLPPIGGDATNAGTGNRDSAEPHAVMGAAHPPNTRTRADAERLAREWLALPRAVDARGRFIWSASLADLIEQQWAVGAAGLSAESEGRRRMLMEKEQELRAEWTRAEQAEAALRQREAEVAALRAMLEKLLLHQFNMHSNVQSEARKLLAASGAERAAEHDARVRREALEEAADIVRRVGFDRHPWSRQDWEDIAAKIRARASQPEEPRA